MIINNAEITHIYCFAFYYKNLNRFQKFYNALKHIYKVDIMFVMKSFFKWHQKLRILFFLFLSPIISVFLDNFAIGYSDRVRFQSIKRII